MDAYIISNREADIAYLECVEVSDTFNDYIDTSFYEEASPEKKAGIFQTLIEKLKALGEKITKFFTDFFTSIKGKAFKEKAVDAVKADKALANKKIEVLDQKRIIKFTKTYQDKINNAKTEEEVDAIVADYEKKRNKAGIFAVAATVAAAVGAYVVHANNHVKMCDEVNRRGQQYMAKYQEACQAQLKEGNRVLQGAKEYANETGTKFNPEGLLDASAGYQAAKKRTAAAKEQLDAYKGSKGYNKYVKNGPSKMDRLVARKTRAMHKVTADGMNAIKGALTGGISKIREAVGGARANAENKSTSRKASEFDSMVGAIGESVEDDDYFFGEFQM